MVSVCLMSNEAQSFVMQWDCLELCAICLTDLGGSEIPVRLIYGISSALSCEVDWYSIPWNLRARCQCMKISTCGVFRRGSTGEYGALVLRVRR